MKGAKVSKTFIKKKMNLNICDAMSALLCGFFNFQNEFLGRCQNCDWAKMSGVFALAFTTYR